MDQPLIDLPKTPIREIDMDHVASCVNYYLQSGRNFSNDTAIAIAALALQDALAKKYFQVALPDSEIPPEVDLRKLTDTRASLAETANNGVVMWGVPKASLPKNAKEGDVIKVHYKSCGLCAIVGEVIEIIQYQQGAGIVIKLMQTNNSFGLSPDGWRYVGLWMPNNSTAQAGFVKFAL